MVVREGILGTSFEPVIETDQSDILRYPVSCLAQSIQNAYGRSIVTGQTAVNLDPWPMICRIACLPSS